MFLKQSLILIAVSLAAPILLDPEVSPNEISVYFDREKWYFTVVGVVNMIELSERHADGQTSITLYGNITRDLDIQDLMNEVVFDTANTDMSPLDKMEAMAAHGWVRDSQNEKPLENDPQYSSFFIGGYPTTFLMTLFIAYISGVIFGLGLALRVS